MSLLTHLHTFDFTAVEAKDTRLLPLAVRGYGPASLNKKITELLESNKFTNISVDEKRNEIYATFDQVEYNFIYQYDNENAYYVLSVSTYAKKKGKTFKAIIKVLDLLKKEFSSSLVDLN